MVQSPLQSEERGSAFHDQVHPKLMYRSLQFDEPNQHFVGTHDDTFSLAMVWRESTERARDFQTAGIRGVSRYVMELRAAG